MSERYSQDAAKRIRFILQCLRFRNGMSQCELSVDLGVAKSHFSAVEGLKESLTVKTIAKMRKRGLISNAEVLAVIDAIAFEKDYLPVCENAGQVIAFARIRAELSVNNVHELLKKVGGFSKSFIFAREDRLPRNRKNEAFVSRLREIGILDDQDVADIQGFWSGRSATK